MRISTCEACTPKSHCSVRLPAIGAVDASVAWYADGLVGLQFVGHELAAADIDDVLGARAAARTAA